MPADNSTVQAASPEEAADRAAIEAVWRQVWSLYTDIYDVPVEERPARVDALMVDPARSQLLEGVAKADQQHLTSYGTIGLHPYWYRAVDGLPYAVIGDCRDTSAFGSMNRETGEKQSVGIPASNTVGRFIRDSDGRWYLFDITYVDDLPCAAQ